MERLKAAVQTVQELKFPLLTSCLTTAVAFLPIALVLINTETYEDTLSLLPQVKKFLREKIPFADCSVRLLESASTVSSPIQVRISGENISQLYKLGTQTKNAIRKIEGTEAVNDNWGNKIKKLVLEVNQAKAKRIGISSQDISYSSDSWLSWESSVWQESLSTMLSCCWTEYDWRKKIKVSRRRLCTLLSPMPVLSYSPLLPPWAGYSLSL